MYTEDDRISSENYIDDTVNYLNSARFGGATPVKIKHRVKTLRNEIMFLKEHFPESQFCFLKNVCFGSDVAETYQLEDLL